MTTISRKYSGTIKWNKTWFQIVPATTTELGLTWERRTERHLKVFIRPLRPFGGDELDAHRILLYANKKYTQLLAATDKMRAQGKVRR